MRIGLSVATALAVVLSSSSRDSNAAEVASRGVEIGSAAAQQTTGDSVAFIAHPDNIQLGLAVRPGSVRSLRNPYEGNKQRIAEGGALFVSYNCADCHGAEGSGGMGPSLADGRWHFGGSAGEVFESIYEGRPDGMPQWGGRISDEHIWRLVAYVQSLSAGKQVSTENFTGKTIERTGH